MTDIKFYNTDIAGRTSSLFQGELFVNLPDRLLGVGNTFQKQVRLSRYYPILEQLYTVTTLGITLAEESAFIEIIGCGGGGGGGSGASQKGAALTEAARGGAGGQGGQGGRFVFSIFDLGLTAGESKLDVNIGAGGAGGAANGANNANGSGGADGSDTWVVKSGLAPEFAIAEFNGGFGGPGGGRPAIGTDTGEMYFGYPFADGVNYYHHGEDVDIAQNIGGQGRGAFGNVTASQGENRNGRSNYYGGGGGGGGGGGWTSGGQGFTTDGGYGGTGSVLINTLALIPPLQRGTTGKYGGGGAGGAPGAFGVNGIGGEAAISGSGGGGGGGGGLRLMATTAGLSAGKGGTGGSGYVILRYW